MLTLVTLFKMFRGCVNTPSIFIGGDYMTLKELGITNDMPRGWLQQEKWHMSLYKRWNHMWDRCKNPNNKDYKTYKDIEIDEKYKFFSNYVNDIMRLENFDKLINNLDDWVVDKDIKSSSRGYYFENLSIIHKVDNINEKNNRCGTTIPPKPVIGVSSTKCIVFNSISSSRKLNFEPTNLCKCLKGKNRTHKGYQWYYLDVIEL